jgi:predicted MFS family arabinose efflux permease
MSLAGVLFLPLGGVLADMNWRLPFLMYLMAFVVLPFAAFILYEPKDDDEGQSVDGHVRIEYFKVGLVYFMGFITMTAFYMIPTQIPFLMENELGISNTMIGMAIAVTTLTGAVSSMFFGRIKSKLRYLSIYIVALALSAVGFFGIGAFPQYATIVMSLAMAGFGFGLVMPNGNLWLMELSSMKVRGRLIGGFTAVMFSGQFISPLIVDVFVKDYGFSSTFMYVAGFLMILILFLAGLRLWYNR